MDTFLETFWNLDQIHGWAETRDPELVRDAALPRYGTPKETASIAIPVALPPTPLLRGQRDIDAELWAASEWAPKIANFVPSKDFQEYAEQRGMPVWRARRYGGIAIIFPLDPAKRSLCHEWKFAPARDRIVVEITLDHIENASGILTDVRLERLNWLSCFERPRQSLHPSKDLRTSFCENVFGPSYI